jgi:hypothetical protein
MKPTPLVTHLTRTVLVSPDTHGGMRLWIFDDESKAEVLADIKQHLLLRNLSTCAAGLLAASVEAGT